MLNAMIESIEEWDARQDVQEPVPAPEVPSVGRGRQNLRPSQAPLATNRGKHDSPHPLPDPSSDHIPTKAGDLGVRINGLFWQKEQEKGGRCWVSIDARHSEPLSILTAPLSGKECSPTHRCDSEPLRKPSDLPTAISSQER